MLAFNGPTITGPKGFQEATKSLSQPSPAMIPDRKTYFSNLSLNEDQNSPVHPNPKNKISNNLKKSEKIDNLF